MYELAKDFQSLMVGVVGFVGVIVTLWRNARLQRQLEERREDREAGALRTALIEELKQQREALRDTADSLATAQTSQDETQGSLIPLERFDTVFRRSLERLGLLERREVSAVFEAYLPLPRLTWRLRRLEELERLDADPWRRTPFEPKEDHVSLTRKYYETAAKMHAQRLPAIDAAIAELEKPGNSRWAQMHAT
jgi:hypothetical protein